jgi:predicted Zn-dependent protease
MEKALAKTFVAAWAVVLAYAQQQATRPLAAAPDCVIPEGRPDQAQSAVRELLARANLPIDVVLACGVKLARAEFFEPARDLFARGVKDYPRNFEVHYNLALADLALRRFDEASTALEAPFQLSKNQQLAREYLRGKIYDATGETVRAQGCFTAAFHGAPQEENYALDLGLFYLRQRDHRRALETLEAGVRYHPQSVYLLLAAGLAEYLDNDPPAAAVTGRKILALEPGFGPAQLLLAVAYYTNGEYEKCLRETAAAISRSGAPPYLYYLHTASLLQMNSQDYPAMLRDLETANREMPRCAFCYFALSKVHQQMGSEQAAIGDLETLVHQVDPAFSNGWYRLATLYKHAGRPADAALALEKFNAIQSTQGDSEAEYLRKFFLSELGSEAGGK